MEITQEDDETLTYKYQVFVNSGQLFNFNLFINNQKTLDPLAPHTASSTYLLAPLSPPHKIQLSPYLNRPL